MTDELSKVDKLMKDYEDSHELRCIEDVPTFFAALGELHDCRIQRIIRHRGSSRVELRIDDLLSNFMGKTGYYPVPACIVCEDATFEGDLDEWIEAGESIWVYECEASMQNGYAVLAIRAVPEGLGVIVCKVIKLEGSVVDKIEAVSVDAWRAAGGAKDRHKSE